MKAKWVINQGVLWKLRKLEFCLELLGDKLAKVVWGQSLRTLVMSFPHESNRWCSSVGSSAQYMRKRHYYRWLFCFVPCNQCMKKRASGQNRKTINLIPSRDSSPHSVSLAPAKSKIPSVMGLSVGGVSMTLASLLLWLLKCLRKRGEGIYEGTPKRFLKSIFSHWWMMSHEDLTSC